MSLPSPLGVYTQAELFAQIEHPPLQEVASVGFGLRLLVGRLLPNAWPDVNIWPEGLTFGVPRDTLIAIARQVAEDAGRPFEGIAGEREFVDRVFPDIRAPGLEGSDVQPLQVVCQTMDGRRGIRFDARRQMRHPHPSFSLMHPLRFKVVHLPLQFMGSDLVAALPEETLEELRQRCGGQFAA